MLMEGPSLRLTGCLLLAAYLLISLPTRGPPVGRQDKAECQHQLCAPAPPSPGWAAWRSGQDRGILCLLPLSVPGKVAGILSVTLAALSMMGKGEVQTAVLSRLQCLGPLGL
jgi:hypothetical protein